MGGNHQHNTEFSRRGPYLLWDVPPLRLPPFDPPPLLRLLPPLRPPELRPPPELDFERELLLPTEPEFLVPELFFWVLPDRGFTELRESLAPEVPFWLLLGLTLPPDRVRSPVEDLTVPLLPGRTCRVLSVRPPDWVLRPEFQTLVPLFLGSTGLMVRWVVPAPVRLPELPRTVVVLPAPRATGTRPERPLLPPARCLKSAPAVRPPSVRERAAVLPPSRIRKPLLPLMRTPSSNQGRSRDSALTPA